MKSSSKNRNKIPILIFLGLLAVFKSERPISETDQYKHLAELDVFLSQNPKLQATLGTDYIIQPDIIVYWIPLLDKDLGISEKIQIATNTTLRETNHEFTYPLNACQYLLQMDHEIGPG